MAQRTNRTEKLDLRLTRAAKQTLQAAASAAHKSVSEFVLETALNEASERLGDRAVFTLDEQKWDAFIKAHPELPATDINWNPGQVLRAGLKSIR